ncbi:hypothetical protein K439DRAFT_1633467 [Ramaria rubella]|nr:hypothetical protein K439DRAFT_1633467 [Ramaria rubella]
MSKTFFVILAVACIVNGGLLVGRGLRVRQALEPTSVPSQCDSICAPAFSDVQACGSENEACLCTATVRNDGVNCANCVASIFPSEFAPLQAAADQDVQGCAQHGTPIAPIKLTGTSPATSSGASTTPPSAGNTASSIAVPTPTAGVTGTKNGGTVLFAVPLPGLMVALGLNVVVLGLIQ